MIVISLWGQGVKIPCFVTRVGLYYRFQHSESLLQYYSSPEKNKHTAAGEFMLCMSGSVLWGGSKDVSKLGLKMMV